MMMIIFITIIIAAFIIHKFHYNTDTIVVVVVIALAIMGFSWYFSSTEKGKRVVKDFTLSPRCRQTTITAHFHDNRTL